MTEILKKHEKRRRKMLAVFLMAVLTAILCLGFHAPAFAGESGPVLAENETDAGAGRSGWVVSGTKAKYYDPETHKAYSNGTYEIEGKRIRFDKKGWAQNYASVGSGKMFRTIRAAVKSLIVRNPAIAKSLVNDTIAYVDIYAGTYQESVNLETLAGGANRSASGIYFKGIGTVNWRSDAKYPTGCLCGYGAFTAENIRFTATGKGKNPAYAYHYEAGGTVFRASNPGVLFKNCAFRSTGNFAAGIGMGKKNSRVTFRDCTFSGTKGGVYLHNSVYQGSDKNLLSFIRCRGKRVYVFDAAKWNVDRTSKLDLRFVKNDFTKLVLDCGTEGANAGKFFDYIPKNYRNFDIVRSYGNSLRAFNRNGK